jgi:hypothetical protein
MNHDFTKIKKISSIIRLPRMGKIRLGVKMVHKTKKYADGTPVSYPREVDYLVVPEEVEKVYGPEPKIIDEIRFPVEDESIFFPQSYKAYGSDQRLKCKGNGEYAERWTPEGKEVIKCTCEWLENKQCGLRAHLMIFLPNVTMGGVYQLDTGSINNIIEINSYINHVRNLFGRCAMVPLKLSREEQKVMHDGKTDTHYLLKLKYEGDLDDINRLRGNTVEILSNMSKFQIEAPTEEGPEPDSPIILIDEEEEPDAVAETVPGTDAPDPGGAPDLKSEVLDHIKDLPADPPEEDPVEMVSDNTLILIGDLFAKHKIKTKDERLAFLAGEMDLTITRARDLTEEQGQAIVDYLTKKPVHSEKCKACAHFLDCMNKDIPTASELCDRNVEQPEIF